MLNMLPKFIHEEIDVKRFKLNCIATDGPVPLVLEFLVLATHQVAANVGLEERDDLGETLVSHVFQHTQDAGLEEDLGGAETVLVRVHLKGRQDLLSHNLAVHKTLGNRVGSQDGVSIS